MIDRTEFQLNSGWSLGLKVADHAAAHLASLEGLKVKHLVQFINKSGLSEKEVIGLIRPFQIYRSNLSKRVALRGNESEQLIRLALLFEHAAALFEGDIPAAQRWLRSPVRGLAGETPLAMARTSFGARMVENLIGRLEHGVIA